MNGFLRQPGTLSRHPETDLANVAQLGRIVLLNGPSSSGKTTVARATRDLVGQNCVVLSIDDLYPVVHPKRRNDWQLFLSLSQVLFTSAAAFGNLGFDVVLDTVFERPECHHAYVTACGPLHPLLARVECPLEVLIERERKRGDRRIGLAADQFTRIHGGYDYDLSVDTSVQSPELCARTIANALAPTAK